LNGHVIVDEIHAHRSDELISALTYATRATPNGLVIATSTRVFDHLYPILVTHGTPRPPA
jgi:hypothetical protein